MSDEYLKLTAYFAERLRSGDRFLADALLDLYGESSVATSVVLRFGPHHELRRRIHPSRSPRSTAPTRSLRSPTVPSR